MTTFNGFSSSPTSPPVASPPWARFRPSAELAALLARAPQVIIPSSRQQLLELALGGAGVVSHEVAYDVPGHGRILEAEVVRCRNGVGVNFPDPRMRRRDPDCMVIADPLPTDKPRYEERYAKPFPALREEIFTWLGEQPLILFPFEMGSPEHHYEALFVGPVNAAFFAAALADLQGMLLPGQEEASFSPRAVVYLAPTFRHTHCEGGQMVIHNRTPAAHEIFSLNLYPGPSAKKGIYGALLNIGEGEGWVTIHGSTVQVITPYDNMLVVTHEGASGGGKSEMLQYPQRQPDGRLLVGENVVTHELRYLTLDQGCALRPVTDDMALAHPSLQNDSRKLVVSDAEQAWFVRVNQIDNYGVDPFLEKLCVEPEMPLIFLNIDAIPRATALIWEHVEDSPGKPCPNPRVILPRSIVPDVFKGAVEVDVRSFGVRCPPCTASRPSYGILGMVHLLPPALAWLWRLVAPRGHDNPSILGAGGLASEGVGSYWPFATGRQVDHANLLLEQIRQTPRTRHVLIPNQHLGVWKTGFMPQWIVREYLARRGGVKFRPDQILPSRCPLLGYSLTSMQVEGTPIPRWLLQVEYQTEVGLRAYDQGASMLWRFFQQELRPYLEEPDLSPLGRSILEAFFAQNPLEGFEAILPSGYA
ncbi:MAG: DUF4914 family protein [Magnetococcales bacterium]|nr:DUF4914 family protein [Magnetococcales bacterium]